MHNDYILLLPVLFPFASAFAGYLIGRKSRHRRDVFCEYACLFELLLCLQLLVNVLYGRHYSLRLSWVCSLGLGLELDGFRAVYASVCAFLWAMTTLFSREYLRHYHNRNRQYFFTLLTLGATVGVFLSAELITTFIFFEIMSFTSYVLVVFDESGKALRAGETYIAVAVIGGMVTLMGLFLLQKALGTLEISALKDAVRTYGGGSLFLPALLTSTGFAAKAGLFPLHIWLPKAHPAAPAPASALLSGILTKSGIFGLLAVSCNLFSGSERWGSALLLPAVVTMVLGAVLALFSTDIKRTLACSSMSQIGFITIGIAMQCLLGADNGLAAYGTVSHMINHSAIKLVLFMASGVFFMNLHSLDLNELRGQGRGKPLLLIVFLIGAASIAGIPGTGGYISKTLLHESIVEYIGHLEALGLPSSGFRAVEVLFLISGGLTAAYMTKLFVALFVEKPVSSGEHGTCTGYVSRLTGLVLGFSAFAVLLTGLYPRNTLLLASRLSESFLGAAAPSHEIHFFSAECLRGAAISLGVGAAVYLLVVRTLLMRKSNGRRIYIDPLPERLDLENSVYRPLLKAVIFIMALFSRTLDCLTDWCFLLLRKTLLRDYPIPPENARDFEEGSFVYGSDGRAWEEYTRSLSFSQLLLGIGVCAIMVYMFVMLLI